MWRVTWMERPKEKAVWMLLQSQMISRAVTCVSRAAAPVTSISLLCWLPSLASQEAIKVQHKHSSHHSLKIEKKKKAILLVIRSWDPHSPRWVAAKREPPAPFNRASFTACCRQAWPPAAAAASEPRSWRVEGEQAGDGCWTRPSEQRGDICYMVGRRPPALSPFGGSAEWTAGEYKGYLRFHFLWRPPGGVNSSQIHEYRIFY